MTMTTLTAVGGFSRQDYWLVPIAPSSQHLGEFITHGDVANHLEGKIPLFDGCSLLQRKELMMVDTT